MSKKKKYKKVNRKEEPKTSKKLIIFPLLLLVASFILGTYLYSNRTDGAIALKEYFNYLSNREYEKLYDMVDTELSKEEFISRVQNIYEGIEAKDISITVVSNSTKGIINSNSTNEKEENGEVTITYNVSMETLAGNINFTNKSSMIKKDGQYKIKWKSSDIFPDLDEDEKVRVVTLESERGIIYDRNGKAIAKEGKAYSIGLVPGKMNETTDVRKIAELLGIDEGTINDSLNASYVQENTFVPLRKISKEKQELKNELLRIKGIMVTDVDVRIYPYKEATSIMTGYVQDKDGKSGLEYAFNDTLKGTDGVEIYIDKDGTNSKTLIKKDKKDGKDVKLTIDVDLQNKIYEQYKDDLGATVSMNYNTGEILALVSTPSYDANEFSLGITDSEWEKLQNDEMKPMYNRYLTTYAPGSSMKPIIGAIGLETNSFTAEEDFGRSGTKWQNDSSWKNLYVTTLEEYSGEANLQNALVYSDNIYFAKAALKIGKTNLQMWLRKFGFNEKVEFVQDIATSIYGSLNSDASIANTGYGQAEVLVNPILMASIYSSFANGGNMMKPYIQLENDEKNKIKYYKQNVISSETANTIKHDLIQVVEKGTAKEAKIEGEVIAGKTGTAEIKDSQDDENGTEIGWFDAFDENGMLIVSMVQDVKNVGGSHYVVKKVKDIFNN